MNYDSNNPKNMFKYLVIAFSSLVIVCATICICVLTPVLFHQAKTPPEAKSAVYDDSAHINIIPPKENQEALKGSDIYDKILPSIVDITSRSRDAFGVDGAGTGIIISKDGIIITNAHVVSAADSLAVTLSNGEKCFATVLGMDEYSDIAVLSIKKEGLVAAEIGEGASVIVGDKVYAIGNAAGELSHSFTQGVVSGIRRAVNVEVNGERKKMQGLIQTDAAINPGNSGGALLNELGQVIGINSFRLAEENIVGIGFAIPLTQAKTIIDSIIDLGYMPRAALLIKVSDYVLGQGSVMQSMPLQGVYIEEIMTGSSLEDTDIEINDVILAADEKEIMVVDDLVEVFNAHKPGDKIKLLVYTQKDGKAKSYSFVLQNESVN